MGFRDLGLGHIVGTPTSGAVIATGSYGLINGGSIRTPGSLVVTYDPSQPGNRGINLENYGGAPDVWVENSPQDELDGLDRELKEAVDEGAADAGERAVAVWKNALWTVSPSGSNTTRRNRPPISGT
jgi:tricorn protease